MEKRSTEFFDVSYLEAPTAWEALRVAADKAAALWERELSDLEPGVPVGDDGKQQWTVPVADVSGEGH